MDRQRLINLAAAMAAITVFGLTIGLLFPLLSIVMEKQGVPPAVIGYNTAMQPVGILLAGFVIPGLVRRIGARTAITAAALATAGIVLLYPFTPIYWGWFMLRILHGACVATLFAVSEAMIVKYSEGAWRSRILGLYASILALSFGGGPLIITVTGTDTVLPFIVGAAILVAATLPMFFLKDDAGGDGHAGAASAFGFAAKAPVLVLAVAVFGIVDAANLGFLPVYGLKKGLSETDAAWLLTAFVYGNVILQMPIGWLADHFPKRAVMAGCAVLTVISAALLPFTFGTWAMWALLLVLGAASAGIYTTALAELGDRFKGGDLVSGTAAFSTAWGFGAFIGALGSGWTFQGFGPDGFLAMQAVVFALFLAALWLRERTRHP
jgi:MFS family permease